MTIEAIDMELENSAPKKASNIAETSETSSLSYLPGTMQSLVDELLAELSQMDDPFEQMNFIILKLMPAVLAEQEQSIEDIAPLIESNQKYNEMLSGMQKDFASWETVKPEDNTFFEDVDNLKKELEADPEYGVQEQMLDSVERIQKDSTDIIAGKGITQEQAAYNAVNAPYSAYMSGSKDPVSYPISSIDQSNFRVALDNTSHYQPFLDQTNQELEILKGLNVNMSKQNELDLKYKVEFYNSYVTSIGSMEDNTSKQRRAPIDRLRS